MVFLLETNQPSEYLSYLKQKDELKFLCPQVDALYGVPQNEQHHPEVDTGLHIQLAMDVAARMGASAVARLAVLTHDFGKACTPKDQWPKHYDHENLGLKPLEAFFSFVATDYGIGFSRETKELCRLVCKRHLVMHKLFISRSTTVLDLIQQNSFEERRTFAEDFIDACEADARGRLGKQDAEYRQGQMLREILNELKPYFGKYDVTNIRDAETHKLHSARLGVVRKVKELYPHLSVHQ